MRGLVRILIMFGPMIFRQVQKFQRSRSRQIAPPQRHQERPIKPEHTLSKNQKPVEEEYYDEDIPQDGEFVDPINK